MSVDIRTDDEVFNTIYMRCFVDNYKKENRILAVHLTDFFFQLALFFRRGKNQSQLSD